MADCQWTWSIDRSLPSERGAGKSTIDQILEQLRQHGWSEADLFAVHLSLEEAVVNAIRHGNQHDCNKQVRVSCKLSCDRLWIQILDQGSGFCPGNVPDPTAPENLEAAGGRGIMLMRSFMNHVEYSPAGNCVTMEKSRTR